MQQDNIREEWRKALDNKDTFTEDTYNETAEWWLSRTISKQDIEKFVEDRISRTKSVDYLEAISDVLTYIKNK